LLQSKIRELLNSDTGIISRGKVWKESSRALATGYKTKQKIPPSFFLLSVIAATESVHCVLCRLLLLI